MPSWGLFAAHMPIPILTQGWNLTTSTISITLCYDYVMSLVKRLPPLLTNSPLSRDNRRGIHCSLWYASDLWPVVGHCISFSSLFYTAIFWGLEISKGYAFLQDLDFLVSCQKQNDLLTFFYSVLPWDIVIGETLKERYFGSKTWKILVPA